MHSTNGGIETYRLMTAGTSLDQSLTQTSHDGSSNSLRLSPIQMNGVSSAGSPLFAKARMTSSPVISNAVSSESIEVGLQKMLISDNDSSQAYLRQLEMDLEYMESMDSSVYYCHVPRLLTAEISRVKKILQRQTARPCLDSAGFVGGEQPVVTMSKTLFAPVDEYPGYNFVGRILGPRGMTVKQMEQDTGCKITVRGRGTDKDKSKQNPGAEEPLHVTISAEDTELRARFKLEQGVIAVNRLLRPQGDPNRDDEMKRKQLMELAIINGTYRSSRPQRNLSIGRPLFAPASSQWLGGGTQGNQKSASPRFSSIQHNATI